MKPCGIVGDAEQNIRTARNAVLRFGTRQIPECRRTDKQDALRYV